MSEDASNPTVECTASEEDLAERSDRVSTVLERAYARAEERADGYALTFEGTDETLAAVAAFVSEERRCCSFAEYEITVSPPYEETRLTVSGPDGTGELFGEFVDRLASATATEEREREDAPPEADDDGIDDAERRRAIRERYADLADRSTPAGESTPAPSCCGDGEPGGEGVDERSRPMGYSDEELESVAPGANLGLGCGNPTAVASLSEGDVVLDLGSGAGFDCFLAAREVGEQGRVVGVDMTPEMVERARANAEENGVTNVEFRLGEIEHLPVADESVDVIVSNCVVNLSPDQRRVFDEAFRVLEPDGRLAISDVVATAEPPADVRADPSSVAACIGGGSTVDDLESTLREAGFEDVSVDPNEDSREFIREWDPERDPSDYLASATIEGRKPER